jgi:hypothetical protein
MGGGRGCRGLLGGGWLVQLRGGIHITLTLLYPRLAAHLFGNMAAVLLLGFVHGKLTVCPHHLHCWCGQPWAASSAAFWLSCLTAHDLFHARHFFSFWAWVAILVPFVRSKKA